jgi:hypothetical protein
VIITTILQPGGKALLGYLPSFLSEVDPRKVAEQFNENYAHGGGWDPFQGFTLGTDFSLKYPGDPAMKPVAMLAFREEKVFVYESAWVAIVQPDGTFEVCRMD